MLISTKFRESKWFWLLGALLFLVLGGYLLQIVSPLRLNTDSVRLLSMASSWVDGGSFLVNGDKDPFPVGYPMFLGLLEKVGVGNSYFFIFVNVLFTVGATIVFLFIITRSFHFDLILAILVSCLVLLSWVLIKHVTIQLTDIPYFFLSGTTMFLLSVGETQPLRRAVLYWLFGALFIFASIAVRTVATCILPAFIFAICTHPSVRPTLKLLREGGGKVVLITFPILVFLVAFYFISSTMYFEWLLGMYQNGNWVMFSDQILFRTSELGAIFSNLPPSKLPNFAGVIFKLVGILACLAISYGFIVRIKDYKVVDVYFISYLFVLLVWPWPDERFWLPILPLLFAYAVIGLQQLGRISIPLLTIWVSGFSIAGFVAIGYSTSISLSGEKFPNRYGTGAYRHSYYQAYGINREIDYSQVDHHIVRLLQRYDSRSEGTVQN